MLIDQINQTKGELKMYSRKLTDREFTEQLQHYQKLLSIERDLCCIRFLGNVDMNHIIEAIDNVGISLFGRLKTLSTGLISWPNY